MKFFSYKNDLELFAKLTGFGLVLYFLSFLGYSYPIANSIFFVAILGLVAFATTKDLKYGVFAVLFELIIGVKGYLFSLNVFGFPVSIRLALFGVVFGMWLWLVFRKKTDVEFAKSQLFKPFSVFTIMLLVGIIVGVVNGNALKNVFFDVNAYFYLALIFPFFEVIRSKLAKKRAVLILFAGAFSLTLFSLFAAGQFTLFHQDSRPDLAQAVSTENTLEGATEEERGEKISHSIFAKNELQDNTSLARDFENKKPPIYRWTQDVAIAEITYLAGPFFRVFSPGQIVSLAIGLLSLFIIFRKQLNTQFSKAYVPDFSKKVYWIIAAVSLFTVLLGFSRSLWLGLLIGVGLLVVNLPLKKAFQVSVVGLAVLFLFGITLRFAAPEAFELISQRISSIVNPSSESAGSNRLNVIGPALEVAKQNVVFGSGFGTTVEYDSIAPEKFGTLRVFTFEWSYLDMLIEVGIIGVVLYLLFIYAIYKKLGLNNLLLFQVFILALLVTHITTPYLNHPLGIGLLLLSATLSQKDE